MVDRPLSADVLHFDLGAEARTASDPDTLERSGHGARTLIKDGPLRVTLIVLEAGGRLAEHHAAGPITVQPVQGRVRFHVQGRTRELGPGELLSVRGGVRHEVESAEGAAFLLTVVHSPGG